MSQDTSFPYDQLHGMSFRQLYSLVIVMARWDWRRRQEQSLVLQRACESSRTRLLQPAYAAVFLRDTAETPRAL
jgi:hypothetical protein